MPRRSEHIDLNVVGMQVLDHDWPSGDLEERRLVHDRAVAK